MSEYCRAKRTFMSEYYLVNHTFMSEFRENPIRAISHFSKSTQTVTSLFVSKRGRILRSPCRAGART